MHFELIGDFDLATQKEGLNFFASAFKEVRQHKEMLGEVLEKDKWRDNLRALPERLSSEAERVTVKVREVLSFLVLGHLRRTVQEKGKKQQDLRRFILQGCNRIDILEASPGPCPKSCWLLVRYVLPDPWY